MDQMELMAMKRADAFLIMWIYSQIDDCRIVQYLLDWLSWLTILCKLPDLAREQRDE